MDTPINPFDSFLAQTRQAILGHGPDLEGLVKGLCQSMEALLTVEPLETDTWSSPGDYQGQLLFEDPHTGFIAVLMTWGPGARTPIHDHGTWGVFGVWHGQVEFSNFVRVNDHQVRPVARFVAGEGDISYVIPPELEIHQIRNPTPEIARSLHIYGRNIGF